MAVYLNRKNGDLVNEPVYKGSLLEWLYGHVIGRFLMRLVVSRPFFSRMYTKSMYRKRSARHIPQFIAENQIHEADFITEDWQSLAQYFIRKPKPKARPWDNNPLRLVSPADARLSVVAIDEDIRIHVKGFDYTIAELLQDREDAYHYHGGLCLIYRLTMGDCHRYYHIDHGTILKEARAIRGRLHTVGPISDGRIAVLRENSRIVTQLDLDHLGTVEQIEVGALTVGSIVNHEQTQFKRGDEKGYFQPGGSTIVLLIGAGRVELDADIQAAAGRGLETKVQLGEGIGRILKK